MTEIRTPAIDVHAHALLPAVQQEVADLPGHARQQQLDLLGSGPESAAVNRAQLGQLGPLLIDPALRLAAMDAAGVDLSLIHI